MIQWGIFSVLPQSWIRTPLTSLPSPLGCSPRSASLSSSLPLSSSPLPPRRSVIMSTLPRHDDAEKGVLDLSSQTNSPPVIGDSEKKALGSLPPVAAPLPVVLTKTDKPKPAKRKVSKWILWQLWFNTYRKLFTLVMTLNLTGVVLAATGHWPYARRYTGALVLGNLFTAILMRNELFGRFLYLFVNTLFAKVSLTIPLHLSTCIYLVTCTVDTFDLETWMHICPTTFGWHPFWMCNVGIYLASF